jgi:hypothetical protein
MNNLAFILWEQGHDTRAAELEEEVLEIRKRVLGQEHPQTLTSMHNLAFTLLKQGFHTRAKDLLTRAYDGRKRVLGAEHPSTLETEEILSYLTAQSLQ